MSSGPTQFSSDVGPAPVKQHRDGQEGEDGEESDREGQWAGFHHKRLPFHVPVNGRHRPGQANSQEDIDGIASSHVPNGGVCVGVLDRWYLTGKGVWYRRAESHKHHSGDRVLEANGAAEVRRQVANDGREEADDDDGDGEAGPAV